MPWASRMGTWQTNHHPTTPTISALLGEFAELANAGNSTTKVGLCQSAARCVVWDDVAQTLGNSDCHLSGNPFSQGGLRCDTWAHAVETPIRKPAQWLAMALALGGG